MKIHILKPSPWSTDEVMKSLELLYDGIRCNGKTHRFCLTEIRGDWKFQKAWLDWSYFLGLTKFIPKWCWLLGSIANPAGMAKPQNFFPVQTDLPWMQSRQQDLHATNFACWKIFNWWILGSLPQTRTCLFPGLDFFLLRSVRALFYHQFFKVISLRGMCSSRQLPTSPLPDVYDKMVCYACDPSWMWLMAGWQCSQKFIAGYNFVWGWMWWWTECLAWV